MPEPRWMYPITMTSPPAEALAGFVHRVVTAFNLSEVQAVQAMEATSNGLWRVATSREIVSVKELTPRAAGQLADLRLAAAFEVRLVIGNLVCGPAPMPDRNGEYVPVLTGVRGQEVPVRVHRWLQGRPPDACDRSILHEAGRTLQTVQQVGAAWSTRPAGSLLDADTDWHTLVERALSAGCRYRTAHRSPHHTVARAVALIEAGNATAGEWVFTHRDFKPENCLVQDGRVAVLDWDESHYCHPRLEAVAAALRWANRHDPHPEAFRAFLTGYQSCGESLGRLDETDFAKWVADMLAWFAYQVRRATGDWPELTSVERQTAAEVSSEVFEALQWALDALPMWSCF